MAAVKTAISLVQLTIPAIQLHVTHSEGFQVFSSTGTPFSSLHIPKWSIKDICTNQFKWTMTKFILYAKKFFDIFIIF